MDALLTSKFNLSSFHSLTVQCATKSLVVQLQSHAHFLQTSDLFELLSSMSVVLRLVFWMSICFWSEVYEYLCLSCSGPIVRALNLRVSKKWDVEKWNPQCQSCLAILLGGILMTGQRWLVNDDWSTSLWKSGWSQLNLLHLSRPGYFKLAFRKSCTICIPSYRTVSFELEDLYVEGAVLQQKFKGGARSPLFLKHDSVKHCFSKFLVFVNIWQCIGLYH